MSRHRSPVNFREPANVGCWLSSYAFGYLTAALASFFVDREQREPDAPAMTIDERLARIEALLDHK